LEPGLRDGFQTVESPRCAPRDGAHGVGFAREVDDLDEGFFVGIEVQHAPYGGFEAFDDITRVATGLQLLELQVLDVFEARPEFGR
jgi:hypothetical protein